MSEALKQSPLHDRHVAAGAKFAEFGGWNMPLEYADGGVLAEHTAVREAVGIFDVSHLGKARVSGPGARAYVNRCLTNDLDKIEPGQAQYTIACDASGGAVDDLIAYLRSDEDAFLIPNAANNAEVVRRLQADAPDGIEITNEHEAYAVLAVQGPNSAATLEAMGLPTDHDYMRFAEVTFEGQPMTVCRTGYTGEHGYELVVASDHAGQVWDAVVAAGEPFGIRPAGLAARDTLRTEMGYPLHGHELSLDITPVMARAGWAVGWKKDAFWGRDALVQQRADKPARTLRGLVANGRGIPRPGMRVLDADQNPVGEVTSGTFSPTKRIGIALALIDTAIGEGTELGVEVRRRVEPFTVTKPPFVEVSTR